MTCSCTTPPNCSTYPNGCQPPCEDIEVKDVSELPIDRFGKIPDYFFTIKTAIDETDGSTKYTPMLTPGDAIFPDGTLANLYPFETNNDSLSVPAGQVLPCYIENTGIKNVIYPADENHPADFLVTEIQAGRAYCQFTGWVRIPSGHNYIIGIPYYRSSTEGQVTTDASETGQFLFKAIDRYTLKANF